MSRNSFIGLCLATVIALALAVLSVMRQPTIRSADLTGEPVLPGLADRLNGLKSVVVKGSDGTMTFDWDGKTFVSRDRGGFPADTEKLSGLVIQMTRLVKLEAKTSVAEKLDRLDLNDPTAKDSRAKEIVLLDRDGKTIADLIVGKRKFTLGGKESGTYVRLPGDNQSWLALGELSPGPKARDWLKRDIADVKDKSIKRVTVVHPDGEKVVVGKLSAKDAAFKIENLPGGKQPASDFVADEYGRVLAVLLLDDVAKADTIPFPKDKTTTAEVDTFEGLHVTLQIVEKDGNTWMKIKADPPVGGMSKPASPEAMPGEPATDWGKVAADINARASGWVFQVPAYEVAPLKKRMSELVKKPESKS